MVRLISILLVASAALFAVGSQIERHSESTQASAEAHTGEAAAKTPAGETPAERRGEVHKEAKLLGVNPEAVGLVAVAVLASVLLAVALWLRPSSAVLLAAVGFGLVFAGFDVREVLHQIDESRAGLIAVAGVLAAVHLLIALLAAAELLQPTNARRAAAAA